MKNVSAALIIKGQTILLTRRASGQKLAGFWEFPGGKQEEGETIEECLERELSEELKVASKATSNFYESVYEYPGGKIKLIGILTEIESDNFTLSVHDCAEWANFSDLLNFNLAPADIPIAKKIIEKYGNV